MASYNGEELNKPFKLNKLKYLVVGTGRSGTVFMAKLLSSIGLPCVHEAVFSYDGLESSLSRLGGEKPLRLSEMSKMASVIDEDNDVSWFKKPEDQLNIVAESSYMAVPFLDHEALDDVTVIHVVRHPMRVINSFISKSGLNYFQDRCWKDRGYEVYHNFISKHLPRILEFKTPIERAAIYWADWNKMIQSKIGNKKYMLYRIESSPQKVFSFLGMEVKDYYKNNGANHIIGLHNEYTKFDQIPEGLARDAVLEVFEKFYTIPRCMI